MFGLMIFERIGSQKGKHGATGTAQAILTWIEVRGGKVQVRMPYARGVELS